MFCVEDSDPNDLSVLNGYIASIRGEIAFKERPRVCLCHAERYPRIGANRYFCTFSEMLGLEADIVCIMCLDY